jgi:hypothetical protein
VGRVVVILTTVLHREKENGSRRSRRLALLVFAILWGLITHGTYAGTGDEPHYQMMAHSLVFDGDLDLTTDYSNPANLSLGGHFEGGAHIQPGKDGRLRPVHDVGLPILFAPYYLVMYRLTEVIVARVPQSWLTRARLNFTVILRHFLSFAMIAVTAWIAVYLLEIFVLLSVSGRRAFGWAALVVLSPPIVSHSFLFFTEIVSAFVAFAVFRWLRGPGLVSAGESSPPSRRTAAGALAAGAAAGYLLLIHARNAGLVAGLLLVAAFEARRWRRWGWLAWFCSGIFVMLAVRTWVTYQFWGSWLTTPHARFGEVAGWEPFVAESVTRLLGWFFDQEHGLLPYAPIYLLVPAGWLALWRRDRDLSVALTLVVAAYLAVIAIPLLNAHGWRGGWTPAARFLVPVSPFLAVLAFAAVAWIPRLPPLVLAIAWAQVLLDAILWQHPGLFWNNGIGTSALLAFLDRGTGYLSAWVPSIFPPLNVRTIALVAAASTGWALVTVSIAGKGLRTRT